MGIQEQIDSLTAQYQINIAIAKENLDEIKRNIDNGTLALPGGFATRNLAQDNFNAISGAYSNELHRLNSLLITENQNKPIGLPVAEPTNKLTVSDLTPQNTTNTVKPFPTNLIIVGAAAGLILYAVTRKKRK